MATIPTPEQGKPILDFSEGTFDGSSYLFQSRNGATEHVNGDDVADYVNTSRIYNGLDTESKTTVGAINEINAKDASDISYSQGVSVADKIDSINTCETIYAQKTYQNDIGTARSIGDYDFRNYRVLRITLYNASISSATRVTVVIVNANRNIGASYYPCVLYGTNGNIRVESTNQSITILNSSFGNSICIGEIQGVR